jgi:hypothetical protein
MCSARPAKWSHPPGASPHGTPLTRPRSPTGSAQLSRMARAGATSGWVVNTSKRVVPSRRTRVLMNPGHDPAGVKQGSIHRGGQSKARRHPSAGGARLVAPQNGAPSRRNDVAHCVDPHVGVSSRPDHSSGDRCSGTAEPDPGGSPTEDPARGGTRERDGEALSRRSMPRGATRGPGHAAHEKCPPTSATAPQRRPTRCTTRTVDSGRRLPFGSSSTRVPGAATNRDVERADDLPSLDGNDRHGRRRP